MECLCKQLEIGITCFAVIIVVVGFATFLIGKDKFTDRLKTLIALLFPLCKLRLCPFGCNWLYSFHCQPEALVSKLAVTWLGCDNHSKYMHDRMPHQHQS